ncbi:MAG: hypothetical protein Fur005_36350 [Roseiflexaceae bacterium]
MTAPTRQGQAPTLGPQLEVIDREQLHYHALTELPLIIGRAETCGLRLADLAISREHATIQQSFRGYTITDLGSINGTFLNGQRLPAHASWPLLPGDVVHFDTPSRPDAPHIVLRIPDSYPLLQIPLGQVPLVIGRADADLVLDHPLISRQHLEIAPTMAGYRVRDLGSTNGTLLHGQPIQQADLPERAILQVGGLHLLIESGVLTVLGHREGRGLLAEQISTQIDGRTIVGPLSLQVGPGELVALAGASGAGKSTILALLSGQRSLASGRIEPLDQDLIGFVPQEPMLHQRLPLGQALGFMARLRLPSDTTPAEIERRVRQVLAEVGLHDQYDQVIATLSGGQRRRAAIAAELIPDPPILLLDEPTAGLDPGLEQQILSLLRALARSGRAVLVATHAAALIQRADRVLFLAYGQLAYAGPPSQLAAQFGTPAGDLAAIYLALAPTPPDHMVTMIGIRPQPVAPLARTAALPGGTQWSILVEREWAIRWRDRRGMLAAILQAPLIGALLAFVARPDALVGVRAAANEARKVLFMLAISAIWFGVLAAARTIIDERPIIAHERRSGLQIGPYLLAKLAIMLPLLLIQILAMGTIVLLRISFPAQGVLWPFLFELLLTLTLAGGAGMSLALMLSAFARTPEQASLLIPLLLIPQILVGGVIFGIGEPGSLQRILSWFTIGRWAMDALGSSADLNQLPLATGLLRPTIPLAEYLATPEHLLLVWAALATHLLVPFGLAWWRLWLSHQHG